MPEPWIVIELRGHSVRPVTHSEPIHLKTYFDENPADRTDLALADGSFIVPLEHSIRFETKTHINCYHQITRDEYEAASYELYVWCEPYGIAALGKPGELVIGRVTLTRNDETRRTTGAGYGEALNGVAPDDEVIVHRLDLANSVVQFIVDEMNTNRTSGLVLRHRDMMDDPALLRWIQRPWSTYDAFREFHTDSGWQGFFQDIIALGGGDWDHKPRIFAIWGTDNRLGNSVDIYYYDYWSNIHFGYIMAMAGYETGGTLLGANLAQVLDRGGTENRFDIEPTLAGWNLGHAHGLRLTANVTRADILNILSRHPHWPQFSRDNQPAPALAPSQPSTLEQLRNEMNRFDRMSPIDQAQFLRSLFGG